MEEHCGSRWRPGRSPETCTVGMFGVSECCCQPNNMNLAAINISPPAQCNGSQGTSLVNCTHFGKVLTGLFCQWKELTIQSRTPLIPVSVTPMGFSTNLLLDFELARTSVDKSVAFGSVSVRNVTVSSPRPTHFFLSVPFTLHCMSALSYSVY